MKLGVAQLQFAMCQKYQWKDRTMADYPPQAFSGKGVKNYRGRKGASAKWNVYENTNSTTVPTNSQTAKVSYDTGVLFTDFKMKATINITSADNGNNGTASMHVAEKDVGIYHTNTSERAKRWIGATKHVHNSNNTGEENHGAHDEDLTLTNVNRNLQYTTATNIYSLVQNNQAGQTGLDRDVTQNYELERSGNTIYFRKYGNGFSNTHTYESSWTAEDSNGVGVGKMQYFIFGGRWNGMLSITVSYRKFEWFA